MTKPKKQTTGTLLRDFLREYRAKNGIESVQVKKDGALFPIKAAEAWTAYLKQK